MVSVSGEPRLFAALDIGESEERLYRWLLMHSGAKVAETSRALALSPARAQRLLESLETKGLATHTPERPRRFIPAKPDVALEALVLQRENDLRRLRAGIEDLTERTMSARSPKELHPMVELINSRKAEAQIFNQMHLSARREVVSLIRPPVLVSRLDAPHERDQRQQRESQGRGIRYRSIVDSELMDLPGGLARVRADIQSGEEYRMLARLPVKMIIADDSRALIPLDTRQADGPSLLVRPSALLDALCALFETLWQRAAPISLSGDGRLKRGRASVSFPAGTEELISLMTAGLNDKKAAAELGISISTLKRRISHIMRALGVRTRFQLGRVSHRHFPE